MSLSRNDRGWALDGVPVGRTLAPASAEEAATVLAEARSAGDTVVPIGRGTRAFTGAPAARIDIGLLTAGLDRVLAYEPADLTVTVETGVAIRTLDLTLAEHGQRLPCPVRDGRGTVGGLVACAPDGLLTLAHGRVRDGVIGATLACPDGTLARGRGRVVKNVAGYDTPRLVVGSLGTLALITDVTFRLLPRPAVEATVVVPAPDAAALAATEAFMAAGGQPVFADVLHQDGSARLVIGIEGGATRVTGEIHRLATLLGAAGSAHHVASPEEAAGIRLGVDDLLGTGGTDRVALRLTGPRAADPAVKQALDGEAATDGLVLERALVRPWLESATFVYAGPGGPSAAGTGRLLAVARRHGPVVLITAPAAVLGAVDVWGPPPGDLVLMRRVRTAFDPDGVLASGRFVGGLS